MRLMRQTLPTAPIAAGALIGGYAVVVASGSRALGGVVLVALGLVCVAISASRDSRRTTALLVGVALIAFVLSHLLGLLLGAWAGVLLAALATAGACWRLSDVRRPRTRARVSSVGG
jgi:hypothetical protein